MAKKYQQLQSIRLQLLPADHSFVGNTSLSAQFQAATAAAGSFGISDDDFKTTCDVLVKTGQSAKGKGHDGSTARTMGATKPDFALQPVVPSSKSSRSCSHPDRDVQGSQHLSSERRRIRP